MRQKPRWKLLGVAATYVGVVALGRATDGAFKSIPVDFDVLTIVGFLIVPFLVSYALFIPARPDDDRWRYVVSLYKRRRVLSAKRVDAKTLNQVLADLGNDELLVAADLPDHSRAGRDAAALEVRRRGIVGAVVPFPTVPSFVRPSDLEGLETAALRSGALIRGFAPLALGLLLVSVFGLAFWNDSARSDLVDQAIAAGIINHEQADTYSDEMAWWIPPYLANTGIKVLESIQVVLMILMVLLVVAYRGAFLFRRRPARVLLLRKFNDPSLAKAYKHLARFQLAPFGHVIALSDKHVRRPFLMWFARMLIVSSIWELVGRLLLIPVLLLLRLTDRTRWGPAFVANARDYRLLARRLHDRSELNFEVGIASYAYLVRSTDAWWKHIIALFINSADVIVLDVSNVTEGTSWEISAISRYGLWDRVVLIAAEGNAEHAWEIVNELCRASDFFEAPLISFYKDTGWIQDYGTFLDAVNGAIRRSVIAKADQQPSLRVNMMTA